MIPKHAKESSWIPGLQKHLYFLKLFQPDEEDMEEEEEEDKRKRDPEKTISNISFKKIFKWDRVELNKFERD